MSQPLSSPPAHDDLKERVRDAVDIVDLVGSYLSLRRSGKGMVGLCPWHDDSRPSLQVNAERQTFRCWVCDIGGDVFTFLMRMERIEFRDALEQLAQRAGIELPRGGRRGLPTDEKSAILAAVAWAAERFRDCLTGSSEARQARDYLASRGLNRATCDTFGLGYAPREWDFLLKQARTAGFANEHLLQAGLVIERQDRSGFYDRFRDRVMFPIHDPLGRCVAFGGRVLPGAPVESAKYINSPETPLFSKSSLLYGLDSAREAMSRSRRAVVVEGYTDCLAARQVGIDDVVAVLGTALGERHVKLLRRYADRIVLVLDGDDAGRRRANEILDVILAEPVDVRIARLPVGVDPCEFVLERGRDAFTALIESAGDALDYRLDEAVAGLGPHAGDDAVLSAVESVLGALARVSRQSPLAPSQARLREDQVIGRLSRRFGIARETLRSRMLALRGGPTKRTGSESRGGPADPPETAAVVRRLPAWDREVIEVLVGVPEGAGLVVREVESTELETQEGRAVLEAARRLHAEGRPVALEGLLLEINDPALQSLLVSIDETNATRQSADSGERVRHLEDALRRRMAERLALRSVRTLKTSRLDPGSEAALLEQLVAQRRAAQGMVDCDQGMTDPKDG